MALDHFSGRTTDSALVVLRHAHNENKMADAERSEWAVDGVIRGVHVYKFVWQPAMGEVLLLQREIGNCHDRYSVSLKKNRETVGHVPREMSKFVWFFPRLGGQARAEVNGRRRV